MACGSVQISVYGPRRENGASSKLPHKNGAAGPKFSHAAGIPSLCVQKKKTDPPNSLLGGPKPIPSSFRGGPRPRSSDASLDASGVAGVAEGVDPVLGPRQQRLPGGSARVRRGRGRKRRVGREENPTRSGEGKGHSLVSDTLLSRRSCMVPQLGPPARCPFSPAFFGEGSPTKIDYRKKGTLILTSLLEDYLGASSF